MPHFELLVTYFSVRKHHLEQIQNDLYKLQRTVETFLVGEFSRKNNFISHVNTKKFFFSSSYLVPVLKWLKKSFSIIFKSCKNEKDWVSTFKIGISRISKKPNSSPMLYKNDIQTRKTGYWCWKSLSFVNKNPSSLKKKDLTSQPNSAK